ncbi:hypothetical protein PR048_017083 [Dryococelus australis]|uniref:Uncharacterized protein n=1 Tax=Dryococelus australis TaxID=614101 RepID=A0ABQ9H949_9NEOP|nr:hypothetical protein PR048_017083 [Dryococelus australis]
MRKEAPKESRRLNTLMYTLKKPNGKLIKVCKKLSLSTFGLGEWIVAQWASGNVEGKSYGMAPSKDTVRTARQKSSPPRKGQNPAGTNKLHSFLEPLPKLPSHYCR